MRSNIFDLARFLQVFMHDGVSNGVRILDEETLRTMEALQTAWLAPGDPLIDWDGWGGTEGDQWAYHAKGYTIYGSNTTVPYAVITFVNQGLDSARGAAFNITRLLQVYVHQYDVTPADCPFGLAPEDVFVIAASVGVVIVVVGTIIVRKMRR
jgi:CubicO group peptidase (beta-lactamase class C family)